MFVKGVAVRDAIDSMTKSLQGHGQTCISLNLSHIPAGFCMLPVTQHSQHSQHSLSNPPGSASAAASSASAVASSASAAASSPHKVPSGGARMDVELRGRLRDWDLEDAAAVLAEKGWRTKKRMRMMEDEHVNKLGLPPGDEAALKKYLQSLRNEAAQGTKQAQGTMALEVPMLSVA